MTDRPGRPAARHTNAPTAQKSARPKQRPAEQPSLRLSPEELKRLAVVIKQMLKE
ncbi:hypothetical protein GWK36_08180 [Caldichromatium japonicum]|uniref:Uncharacterized protein n=1 Tax=Caldichromatium japonicum TaxID=2699430 RepID=A0A6G7VDK2_9GAMM|nr:hypothetical protein [Caldichromatium japonicum]QIK37965.1 hypothetical protein GWK36_08180 [Caldichromatium japonicum]